MALQGTLESFGISEIFQLVSQQGKTGTLEIDTGQGVARVRFREGRLVEAWPDRRSPSELIGSLLVRAGAITEAQLDHALRVQRESLRPLGDILIRIGALRVTEFQEILSLQHRETVYRILQLRRGSFFFRNEPVEIEDGVSSPLDVGTLLMEGFRQIDEWPKLQARVPGDARVCLRTEAEATDLPRDRARVLALVDGVSTVRQIVDRSRLGEFVAREALSQLLEAGLVATADAVRPPAMAPPARRSPPWAADLAVALLLLAAGALAIALALANAAHPVAGAAEALRQARAAASHEQERARAWARARPAGWPALAERGAGRQPRGPRELDPTPRGETGEDLVGRP